MSCQRIVRIGVGLRNSSLTLFLGASRVVGGEQAVKPDCPTSFSLQHRLSP